ncbi:MAG: MaoC family dehydratase [Candidatus Aminicenantaceae bacterium]
MSEKLTVKKLNEYLGKEVDVSEWIDITQKRINDFAQCTKDKQWIHIDVEKARKSPLRGTVAHGFLLLSFLPYLSRNSKIFSYDCKMIVNYGLNKVRFISPVKSGSRIRSRAVLKQVEKKGFHRILALFENTIEVEGKRKPALVAETLVLFYV